MPICNLFHEKLAKNGKITTFTGVTLFDALVRTAQVSLNLENRDLDHRNLRLMLKISYALFLLYLNWFRRNSLLKCVLQPEIAKDP